MDTKGGIKCQIWVELEVWIGLSIAHITEKEKLAAGYWLVLTQEEVILWSI
jgi:hypothetical protein